MREKEKEQKKGSFLGFVLLSENKWDKQQLIADFKEMWDIDATEDEKGTDVREDSLGFSVGDTLVVISMMPAPIPEHEAEECASNNYLWEDAVEVRLVAVNKKRQRAFIQAERFLSRHFIWMQRK